jgi:EAL domain-containing protein (putative c-di-GMP-specific phosphodiesterase class I)
MNNQKIWERKVEDDMERALANREFQVYLQPKINTSEEKLGGAEALVRWIHPTEGFVPPNRFIPIFEQNGFILKLDDFMLEEVAKQQAKWISEGWQVVPISVNVSRAHFTREDLAEHISEIVDRYQVPHEVIELELTESAFFDDKEMLLTTVKKLRDAGFSVSMDDFGAGYSSLNSLKELSLDVLKIDADFFRGSDSLERGMLIVTEVINLAKKLNMKIVAEGIESREQVDFLKEQECDLIQGYYFAKPMPLSEFEKNYKNV